MGDGDVASIRYVEVALDLEELVLRHAWYECGSAGVDRGDYLLADVTVDVATLAEMTGHSPASAADLLEDDVALAGGEPGAAHWDDMLDGDFVDDSVLPPVLLLHEDGWEVLDGNHQWCLSCVVLSRIETET